MLKGNSYSDNIYGEIQCGDIMLNICDNVCEIANIFNKYCRIYGLFAPLGVLSAYRLLTAFLPSLPPVSREPETLLLAIEPRGSITLTIRPDLTFACPQAFLGVNLRLK